MILMYNNRIGGVNLQVQIQRLSGCRSSCSSRRSSSCSPCRSHVRRLSGIEKKLAFVTEGNLLFHLEGFVPLDVYIPFLEFNLKKTEIIIFIWLIEMF